MSEPLDPAWGRRRTSFDAGAAAYATGRPSYPPAALEWVLPPGARDALDLAAGTGRLTEGLLALGLSVVAVEPLDGMRAHVPDAARALAGTAEQIPLDDASVDAVLVGQAFHWFDATAAMAEIRRVLRPGGRVGLLWNLLDDGDPFVDRLATLIGADERVSSMREDQAPPYAGVPGFAGAQRRLFHHREPYDAERLAAYTASRSSTLLLGADERADLLDRVRALASAGPVELAMVCEVWRDEAVR